MSQRLSRGAGWLLAPAAIIFIAFLVLPMANVVEESFRLFVPGRVGSTKDAPYTVLNYAELLSWAYVRYFLDTLRIGLIASVIALAIAFPIAYLVARFHVVWVRNLMLGLLVTMMFLSSVVRVYALELTFGPVGLMKPISRLLGMRANSPEFAEMLVVGGLLHYVIPVSALILVGNDSEHQPQVGRSGAVARRVAMAGAPRYHRPSEPARHPCCVRRLLHAEHQRVRGPADTGQGTRHVRVQPDLQSFQRDRELPERSRHIARHVAALPVPRLRNFATLLGGGWG